MKTLLRQKIFLAIFGLFLFCVFLECALNIGGGVYLFLQNQRNVSSLKNKDSFRIVCIGESTTAMGGEQSYPRQLEEILNKSGLGINFVVINRGVPAVDTTYIINNLEDNIKKYSPDMIVAMMGVNDNAAMHMLYKKPIRGGYFAWVSNLKIYRLGRLIFLTLLKMSEGVRQVEGVKKENLLQKKAEYPQKNEEEWIRLGDVYFEQIEIDQARDAYQKAVEINPKSLIAYAGLGFCEKTLGNYSSAEDYFKKAIEIDPARDDMLIELGRCYKHHRKYDEAEEVFKKAITLFPDNFVVYLELGWLYREVVGKAYQGIEVFEKASKIFPNNYYVLQALGHCYREEGKYELAEESLNKAMILNKDNDSIVFLDLGWTLCDQRKYSQAAAIFKKATALFPENPIFYRSLATVYSKTRQSSLARINDEIVKNIEKNGYAVLTERNFQTLKKIADFHKIKLVCVQYPMRNVKPLKELFSPSERQEIIFVDNKEQFANALKNNEHSMYFSDMFGGDFGHCTFKGNHLLASNVANEIIRYLKTYHLKGK